jgi:hypothetical protein
MTIVVRMDWHCDGMPEAEKGGFVSYDDYAALRDGVEFIFSNCSDDGVHTDGETRVYNYGVAKLRELLESNNEI